MGTKASTNNQTNEKTIVEEEIVNDIIQIELESTTPIVGIEIQPLITLKYNGGCIFEWFRIENNNNLISLSDSCNYNPQIEDLNYKLLFKIILIDDEYYLKYGKCFSKEIITKPVVNIPNNLPKKIYLNNDKDKILDYKLKTKILLTYYKPDYNFTIGSYNLKIKNKINNLDFIYYKIYRMKLLYKEIIINDCDCFGLQNITSDEYNEWNLELSKIGYSNIAHLNNLNIGNVTFYKRAKFSRFYDLNLLFDIENELELNYLNDLLFYFKNINLNNLKKYTNLLNNLILNKEIPSICSFIEFEMKDNSEICKVFNHLLINDKIVEERPTIVMDQLNYLFLNINLFSLKDLKIIIEEEEEDIFYLLQLIYIIKYVQKYIQKRSLQNPKLLLSTILVGNINQNEYLQKYLENNQYINIYKYILQNDVKFISKHYNNQFTNYKHAIYFSKDHFQILKILTSTILNEKSFTDNQQHLLATIPTTTNTLLKDYHEYISYPNEYFVGDEPFLKSEIQWLDPYEFLN
ncbi:hypothetical protein ABK040_012951 [Willaertia magna]